MNSPQHLQLCHIVFVYLCYYTYLWFIEDKKLVFGNNRGGGTLWTISPQDRVSPSQTYMSPPTNMASRRKKEKKEKKCWNFTLDHYEKQKKESEKNCWKKVAVIPYFVDSISRVVLILSLNSLAKLTMNSLEVLELICVTAGITASKCSCGRF